VRDFVQNRLAIASNQRQGLDEYISVRLVIFSVLAKINVKSRVTGAN
jgi:hypothetical protein